MKSANHDHKYDGERLSVSAPWHL